MTSRRFTGPLRSLWPALDRDDVAGLVRHPLPVPPASDRAAWSRVDTALVDRLRARAEAELGTPWPAPLASDFARYVRDGDRVTYEAAVFGRQQRLTRAAVTAAHTLDPAWLDQVTDGVVLLCEQSTWCWPAHEHASSRSGRALPDVTDPCVDLGAGEALAHLAWTDHLLGPELEARTPGLRARVRHEAYHRVLAPLLASDDWWWLGFSRTPNNWNPWIVGNVLVGAVALVDDPALQSELVRTCLVALDRFLATLPDDGAIDEGVSYWWEGACRALELLDVLRHVTGGALDALTALPALRATVGFPGRMHLGGPWCVSVADSRARTEGPVPWHALYRAGQVVGDRDALAYAASQRGVGDGLPEAMGLGRVLVAATDPGWLSAGPASSPLPATTWLPSVQLLVARERAGDATGLTVTAKGGHNGEQHNHLDVGTVTVALHGVPVLVDAGRPTYTAQTFGPDRYAIWTMQSQWHSVPLVRGVGQGVGEEYRATDVRVDLDGPTFTADLARAYPVDDLRSWVRRVALDRERSEVVVRDTWELSGPGQTGETRWVVAGTDVRLVSPGRVEVATLGGAMLCVDIDGGDVVVSRHELTDPIPRAAWGPQLWRLDVRLPDAPTGTVTCRVREAQEAR